MTAMTELGYTEAESSVGCSEPIKSDAERLFGSLGDMADIFGSFGWKP